MSYLIALCSRNKFVQEIDSYFINRAYIDVFTKRNIPCIVVVPTKNHDYSEIAQLCDGLVLCGGSDVNAEFYNEEAHPLIKPANKEIDEMDLALIKAFHQQNKPILGICRGLQVLNVGFGGTLVQDIPSILATDINHSQKNSRFETSHEVEIVRGSFLDFNDELIQKVNSMHHQCIKTLAPNFKIAAKCGDIIEAFEGDNIYAVQWHPECLSNEQFHDEIITRFINQIKEKSHV